MLRILVLIAVSSILALGAVWLAESPGDVSIVWRGVTIETTVAMAAIGVLALVLAGMLIWSAIRFLFGLPTAFSFASVARKRVRGYDAVSRGMVAIGSGDPAAARRHAADARKLLPDAPLALLLSAQSAQLSGDKPAAEAAFKSMLDDPATRVLGLRGLFVEARRRGDQIAARAFADEAVRLSPSLSWANDALLEFHSTSGEWEQARNAVERRAALRLSDKTEAKRHRAVLLAAEAQTKQASDPAGALSASLAALKLAPGLTAAAVTAGALLVAKGELRKAAKLIETAWLAQPHPDLAAIYIQLRKGDSASDRLEKARILRKLKPVDPESAFIVAEAALAAREFAQAREALSPLIAAVPTARTCLLMAQLEDAEHGSAGRAREWLARSARAPRDNVWVADGVVSETWLPVSPVSGRLDAFAWTLPPAIIGSARPAIDAANNLAIDHDVMSPSLVLAPDAPSSLGSSTVVAQQALAKPILEADIVSGHPSAGQANAASATESAPSPSKPPIQALSSGAVAADPVRAPDDPGPELDLPSRPRRAFWERA